MLHKAKIRGKPPGIGATLGIPHGRTDSEAMQDLEGVFKSVDIDGEGRLDQGSFMTALMALHVQIPEDEIDAIFEELDVGGEGFIEYAQFLTFLQMGKIPSSLLNRVKKSSVPRKSIILGTAPKGPASSGGGSLLPISELKKIEEEKEKEKEQMTPQQRKMVQRAVIVIKKAAMKNIKRAEVIEFLMDKGMDAKDIEIAFSKAQETVMSPAERVKYLQDLAQSHKQEKQEQEKINKYLTNELTAHTREIEVLREVIRTCSDILKKSFPKKFKKRLPTGAAEEINARLKTLKGNMESAKSEGDERASKVHERDLECMQNIARFLSGGQNYHGYVLFHCLDEVIRDAMPLTQQFLSDFCDPDMDDN